MAWGTINTDDEPDEAEYDECIFSLKAQGIQSEIVVNFLNVFESRKIELLTKIDQNQYDASGTHLDNPLLAHVQTDLLIEEIANLQLETLSGGRVTVKQNTKSIDKDRFSSLAYLLYFLFKVDNKPVQVKNTDFSKLMIFRQPKIR